MVNYTILDMVHLILIIIVLPHPVDGMAMEDITGVGVEERDTQVQVLYKGLVDLAVVEPAD